jgi:hypothetical protein
MVLDLLPRREIMATEKTSIPKPDIEDALLQTPTSSNAESMVDQTRMTRVLTLSLNALVSHGSHNTSRLVRPIELLEKVGYTERQETTSGDH